MRASRLLFLLVFLIAPQASAQEAETVREVQVLHADSLVGRVVDGRSVRTLFGNVRLRQGETDLRSDRATQFLDAGEIHFVGRVEIAERGDSLRADTVYYNTRTKVGRAIGSVWLTDGDVVVMAPSGNYDTRSKHAVFTDGVTLVDSASTLRSSTGEYWSDERRAEFAGSVRLDEDRSITLADSITYLRDDEFSIARGDVAILHLDEDDDGSSTDRTYLFGAHAEHHNQTRFSRIRGDPLLMRVEADSLGEPSDTMLVRAETLLSARSDSLDRLTAVSGVRIWQRRLAAVGDSLVFDRHLNEEGEASLDEARLFGIPVAWVDAMQLNGDTLRVIGRGGSIDSLYANSRSFVARFDSTLQRIHQVKGRDLAAAFVEDTIRTMRTWPNAEAIYFLHDEDDGLRGAVRGSGDEIVFRFSAGELHRVSILSGTEGEYFEAEDIPEPLELEGYRWEPEIRPEKDLLLGGVVPQERFGQLPPPAPVTAREQAQPPVDQID